MFSTLLAPGVLQTLGLIVVVALLVKWAFFRKKFRLPPGPRPLPFLGNVLEIKGRTIWDTVQDWSKAHGSVCTVYLGTAPSIVISSYEALNEAFVNKAEDFSNRPSIASLDYASGEGKDIVASNYDPVFKQRRKVAIQTLRQYITGNQHTERINESVDMTVENILMDMRDSITNGSVLSKESTVDLKRHLNYLMITMIHSLCFGSMFELDSEGYKKVLNFFETISGVFTGFWEDRFPILTYCPTKAFRNFKKDIDRFQAYLHEQIENERKLFEGKEDRHTIVQEILMAEKQAEQSEKDTWKEAVNDKSLSYILTDLFFAAIDTTRETLAWVFLVLSDRQDIQKKVHEEIDATIGSAVPSREHRSGLVYTEAVIHEVLRMFPVAPLSLAHETARDTHLQNYDIPEKTSIIPNLLGILRDPATWKSPDEFIPERFIDEKTHTLVRPQEFVTFSVGNRNCAGEFVARQTLLFSVVNLLQKLEFHREPGVSADYEPDPTVALNYVPKPYHVVARLRK